MQQNIERNLQRKALSCLRHKDRNSQAKCKVARATVMSLLRLKSTCLKFSLRKLFHCDRQQSAFTEANRETNYSLAQQQQVNRLAKPKFKPRSNIKTKTQPQSCPTHMPPINELLWHQTGLVFFLMMLVFKKELNIYSSFCQLCILDKEVETSTSMLREHKPISEMVRKLTLNYLKCKCMKQQYQPKTYRSLTWCNSCMWPTWWDGVWNRFVWIVG